MKCLKIDEKNASLEHLKRIQSNLYICYRVGTDIGSLVVHALILFLTTASDVSSFSVNFPYLVNEERVSLIIQCLCPFSV